MDFVSQDYWDDNYEKIEIDINTDNDPVSVLIRKYFSKTDCLSVLEIGCFPGRYLKKFGELGYELNGIDITPRTESDLKDYLNEKGYKIGNILKEDLFKYKHVVKYDVVCSFGFIEHFSNWEEVFDQHLSNLNDKGILFITVPNFRGIFQRLFHFVLDYENLKRHNLKVMNISKWIKYLDTKKVNYNIIFKGPFGDIDFWVDKEPVGSFKTMLFNSWNRLFTYFKNKKISTSNLYSPYIGLIVRVEK
jgi:L-malate glycosyltransferase